MTATTAAPAVPASIRPPAPSPGRPSSPRRCSLRGTCPPTSCSRARRRHRSRQRVHTEAFPAVRPVHVLGDEPEAGLSFDAQLRLVALLLEPGSRPRPHGAASLACVSVCSRSTFPADGGDDPQAQVVQVFSLLPGGELDVRPRPLPRPVALGAVEPGGAEPVPPRQLEGVGDPDPPLLRGVHQEEAVSSPTETTPRLGASAARLGPLRHVLRPTPPKTRHLRTRHLISSSSRSGLLAPSHVATHFPANQPFAGFTRIQRVRHVERRRSRAGHTRTHVRRVARVASGGTPNSSAPRLGPLRRSGRPARAGSVGGPP